MKIRFLLLATTFAASVLAQPSTDNTPGKTKPYAPNGVPTFPGPPSSINQMPPSAQKPLNVPFKVAGAEGSTTLTKQNELLALLNERIGKLETQVAELEKKLVIKTGGK